MERNLCNLIDQNTKRRKYGMNKTCDTEKIVTLTSRGFAPDSKYHSLEPT